MGGLCGEGGGNIQCQEWCEGGSACLIYHSGGSNGSTAEKRVEESTQQQDKGEWLSSDWARMVDTDRQKRTRFDSGVSIGEI